MFDWWSELSEPGYSADGKPMCRYCKGTSFRRYESRDWFGEISLGQTVECTICHAAYCLAPGNKKYYDAIGWDGGESTVPSGSGEWQSCSVRLPDLDKPVWVAFDGAVERVLAMLVPYQGAWRWHGLSADMSGRIPSHWQDIRPATGQP